MSDMSREVVRSMTRKQAIERARRVLDKNKKECSTTTIVRILGLRREFIDENGETAYKSEDFPMVPRGKGLQIVDLPPPFDFESCFMSAYEREHDAISMEKVILPAREPGK